MTSMLRAIAASGRPSVEVGWTTPVSAASWDALCRLHRQQVEILMPSKSWEVSKRRTVSLGPVLPDQDEPRIARLIVKRAFESEGHEVLQWTLEVGPSPQGEPPELLQKLHESLGGRPGLIDLMRSALGDGDLTVARYEIKFLLDAEQWNCRIVPRPLSREFEAPVLELSPEAKIEHMGYRLPEGANGIYELVFTYFHEQPLHMVVARARGTLKLDQGSWLPFADEVKNLIVAKLFSRKEPQT
jgi:hypothetical protein